MRNILQVSIQLTKIFFLISFALFSPRLFLLYSVPYIADAHKKEDHFLLGAENITETTKKFFLSGTGKLSTVALITNYSGIDQSGMLVTQHLREHGINVKKIILPTCEGEEQEFELQKIKKETAIPQYCLYTHKRAVVSGVLADVEAVVFDLSDVSIPYHAYVKVICDILSCVAQHKKPLIVLDRPNLMSETIEGALMRVHENAEELIPVRSGMTSGELFQYLNGEQSIAQADLRVVPMRNFHRLDAAKKYMLCCMYARNSTCCSPHNGLLGMMAHVEPLDVAIGTSKAYMCVLLPESIPFEDQQWFELQLYLQKQGVESRLYRYYNSHHKEHMRGLELSVQHVSRMPLFHSLISILSFFKQNNIQLKFSPYFDVVAGSSLIREVVEGNLSYAALQKKINNDLQMFFKKARAAFIYQPLPEILFL